MWMDVRPRGVKYSLGKSCERGERRGLYGNDGIENMFICYSRMVIILEISCLIFSDVF